MNSEIERLIQEAERLANSGNWQAAEQKWSQIASKDPNNGLAFFRLGIHAFQRAAYEEAIKYLVRAKDINPKDPMLYMMIANVERARKNKSGEINAIDGALSQDPYFYPALLLKGNWQEKYVNAKTAAATYKNVIIIAPPETHWPPELKQSLKHARDFSQKYANNQHEKLKQVMGSEWENNPKWREAISILAGVTKPYYSLSNQFHVPRLPALTFYDISKFDWVKQIEEKTDDILSELEYLLENRKDGFSPYIHYNPGEPVNQWAELNDSSRWETLPIFQYGKPHEENQKICPITTETIKKADLAYIEGLCPNVIFSALHPHTEIPPHNGETNARLIAHLPLIVPDDCVFKVGFDSRPWKKGEIFAFDDCLEHAAYNNSNELRVVMLFDIWNPLLTNEERELVKTLIKTVREID